jgi:hypothetical protein
MQIRANKRASAIHGSQPGSFYESSRLSFRAFPEETYYSREAPVRDIFIMKLEICIITIGISERRLLDAPDDPRSPL